LLNKTAELERQLDDVRMSIEWELTQPAHSREAAGGQIHDTLGCALADADREHDADSASAFFATPTPSADFGSGDFGDQTRSAEWRTEVLLNQGRHSSYRPGLSRARKVAIGTAVVAVLVTAGVLRLSSGGASWPSSVATVQSEIAKACNNPDVKSEPGQVNFACAKTTRQILWVFALMTSGDNPGFNDTKTGRLGLEPITPAQGGQVAWSLNLHRPYDPYNAVDSLEVAARAINSIIGGATLTGADGKPVVQPGLESDPANCLRYTGSAAVTSRQGFPHLCARPVTSPAGQAALVADVYQRWVVGAAPRAAQDAAVLFENANNPGDSRVRAILRQLPNLKL
jgi:hypothetical protein